MDHVVTMPLAREVGLSPSDIVLDRDPATLPRRGRNSPIFGPCLLWPNGWMDQDATCHGSRSRPRPHCAVCGPSFPSLKTGRSPQFSSHSCCGEMVGWIKMPLGREVSLSQSDIVLDGDRAPLTQKGQSPQFCGPYLLWPNGWMDQDGTWQ